MLFILAKYIKLMLILKNDSEELENEIVFGFLRKNEQVFFFVRKKV